MPIGAYAAIGDGRTLALVSAGGSVDWMCLPQLDSPSVFGALLSPRTGGRFVVQPAVPFEVSRRYVERTNVLETTFATAEGQVRVIDAMTLDAGGLARWRELVRRVEGLAGAVPMRWRFEPRFDYGHAAPEVERIDRALVARHRGLQLGLLTWDAGADETGWAGEFEAGQGKTALLAMTAVADAPLPLPDRDAVERRLRDTLGVWRAWVGRHTYDGSWTEAVERSLLAIRLLCDSRAGAIAAAGTTSLPEVIGGGRNFDYRFGWVRDASFTLDALLAVGLQELTHASMTWLLQSVARTHPRIDPVYGLDTDVIRSQAQLALPGYRLTTPVNVGNQAGSQLQLGGWGDLMQTIYSYVTCGHVLTSAIGERLADNVDLLCRIWRREDAGLWELSDSAQYTTSKVSCWVAVQRLLQLVQRGQVPARHVSRWTRERDAIRGFIERHLWSDRQRSYVQKSDSDALDCGVLLASRRGYADPAGARMTATIDAICRELSAGGPLLYRYSGMQDEENAFLACSFWLVEALALARRFDEAADVMDALIPLANDVGLFSEEIVPSSHELRGNFPQALTHLSLINAAAALRDGGP